LLLLTAQEFVKARAYFAALRNEKLLDASILRSLVGTSEYNDHTDGSTTFKPNDKGTFGLDVA
jgi:hypothetical protein